MVVEIFVLCVACAIIQVGILIRDIREDNIGKAISGAIIGFICALLLDAHTWIPAVNSTIKGMF